MNLSRFRACFPLVSVYVEQNGNTEVIEVHTGNAHEDLGSHEDIYGSIPES